MHLLVTGFEAFGGASRNASEEIVTDLGSGFPASVSLSTLVLPVVTGEAARILIDAFERLRPDLVVMLGEAGGSDRVRLEEIAVNKRRFSMPDNSGRTIEDDVVVEDGPERHRSTLPTEALFDHLQGLDLPVERSESAGTFLCNEVSYRMLHHLDRNDSPARAGFVHVPRVPQQVTPGEPSLTIERSRDVVRRLLLRLVDRIEGTTSSSSG